MASETEIKSTQYEYRESIKGFYGRYRSDITMCSIILVHYS